ncbi:hypothetical protein [Yoonia sp. 208BN28-4]|uniref:hypothetical protein n=1 Tax=Yoonia sp. 208BN28-4 TaxID=3126505 RepID=UPI00309870F9
MTIKTLIIAAAAAAVTATSAAANQFPVDNRIDTSDILELGSITADNAGVLEVYDYRLGTQGRLLGTDDIHAGANTNVRVPVGIAPTGQVLAVLTVDGQPVAAQRFYVEND